MHRAFWLPWALVLPPIRSVVLTVVLFETATAVEARNSVNAPGEAEIAGVFAALPWFALFCVEIVAVLVALWANRERSRAGQVASVVFLTAASIAIGGGWIAWALSWGTPASWATSMTLILVLPLAPAWIATQVPDDTRREPA